MASLHFPSVRWLMPPKDQQPIWTISWVITLLTTLATLVYYPKLPPVVPLFYSLPQLSQHLVARNWVWLVPGLMFGVLCLHLSIIKRAHNYQPLLLQLFAGTTIAVQLILALAIVRSMTLVAA